MAKTSAERAADLKERRKRAGQKRAEYWLTPVEKYLLDVQLEIIRSQVSGKQK